MSCGTETMKLEMVSELCGVCGETGELLTPEEYDAGRSSEVPLRTMLLHINNNKVIPEGKFCSSCVQRTIDAYEFSTALSAKSVPPLSEKIRLLRKRLLDLTQKIDVFIVVGSQDKTTENTYSEDDIIMVDRDALAVAVAENEDMEKARNAAGESVYQCTICPMSFQVASEYHSHVTSHGEGGRHCCWTCGAQFTSTEALRDHTLMHRVNGTQAKLESGPTSCPICFESFSSRAEVSAHARLVHTGPDVALCPTCLQCIPADQLPAHQLAHRQADRFVCGHDMCILRFPTRNDLMTHIRSCHVGDEKRIDKNFDTVAQVSESEKNTVVPCANCDRTFGSVAAMKRHARVHRRNKQKDEEWLAPGEGVGATGDDIEYLELETLDENDY